MLGLETALSVVQQTMVDTGLLDWAGVASGCRQARQIGRLAATAARSRWGAGNVVLYDPAPGRRRHDSPRCRATPRTPARAARPGGRDVPARHPTVLDGKLHDGADLGAVAILFALLLAYLGMWRGWTRGRKHDLPPLSTPPSPTCRAQAAVRRPLLRHHASGDWLDRVVARGSAPAAAAALLSAEGST